MKSTEGFSFQEPSDHAFVAAVEICCWRCFDVARNIQWQRIASETTAPSENAFHLWLPEAKFYWHATAPAFSLRHFGDVVI